ncbi:MAG: CBS domain-containing protein [Nitrososphaerales archaeon]
MTAAEKNDLVLVSDAMTRDVATIDASKRACDAARLMADRHVGCLIVVNSSPDGRGIGIITERDLVWKLLAESFDPSNVLVSDVMTTPLVTISSDKTLESAAKVMTEFRVRRLPVVDGGALVGIITATDLARTLALQNSGLVPVLNAVSRYDGGPYG